MKAPKHHAEDNRVMVGRVEVARFTDNYQAESFIRFIEKKDKEAIPCDTIRNLESCTH